MCQIMGMNQSYNSTMSHNMRANYKGMNQNEQQRLLHEIGMIDFVIVEMTLYLDTHPDDAEAIDYFNYYAKLKNRLMKEYAEKYAPLTLATADNSSKSWDWVLQEPPWKGACK